MERFVKGDVVVVPFPFSDLSTVKRRPAPVVAALGGDDVILCQITSQQVRDHYAVGITDMNFVEGTLRKPSNVRPNRLISASTDLILYRGAGGMPSAPGEVSRNRSRSVMLPSMNVTRRGGARRSPGGEVIDDHGVVIAYLQGLRPEPAPPVTMWRMKRLRWGAV